MHNLKLTVDVSEQFFGGSHFLSESTGVGPLVTLFLETAIVVSGIVFLFLIVFGGLSMIAGAGSSSTEQMERGKKAVTAAIAGMILILTSYWVLRIIELILGDSFVTGV